LLGKKNWGESSWEDCGGDKRKGSEVTPRNGKREDCKGKSQKDHQPRNSGMGGEKKMGFRKKVAEVFQKSKIEKP